MDNRLCIPFYTLPEAGQYIVHSSINTTSTLSVLTGIAFLHFEAF